MPEVMRRTFLAGCGVVGIGAMSASLPVTWTDLNRLANEEPLTSDKGILVLITLYGGNDGLNTVIPYTNSAYFDARPDLAYSAENVLKLDDEFGLNPGLKGLSKAYQNGSLAIVRGVGYPDQDRSHFRSMDIWQSGSTDNDTRTGWIGRWLDLNGAEPTSALNVGSVLPVLAIGSARTAATLAPADLYSRNTDIPLLRQLANPDPGEPSAMRLVRDSYSAAAQAAGRFSSLVDESAGADATERAPENSIEYQLEAVTKCIRAGLPTEVYCVSLTGFDTHAREKGTQRSLLRTLDVAMTKFLDDMSKTKNGTNVVVMAYSEFGRRVAANASDGTDHGTSGPVFIAGAPVKGGMYGDDPDLTDLTQGDLKTTTDFRDVYAEILAKTLKSDPAAIINGNRKSLGFLA